MHPIRMKRADSAIAWPSFTGQSVRAGVTPSGNVTVYFDEAGPVGTSDAAAALLKVADLISTTNGRIFGIKPKPVNVILFALGGATDGTGGADHHLRETSFERAHDDAVEKGGTRSKVIMHPSCGHPMLRPTRDIGRQGHVRSGAAVLRRHTLKGKTVGGNPLRRLRRPALDHAAPIRLFMLNNNAARQAGTQRSRRMEVRCRCLGQPSHRCPQKWH